MSPRNTSSIFSLMAETLRIALSRQAYAAGRAAAQIGPCRNPYQIGTAEHTAFTKGYAYELRHTVRGRSR